MEKAHGAKRFPEASSYSELLEHLQEEMEKELRYYKGIRWICYLGVAVWLCLGGHKLIEHLRGIPSKEGKQTIFELLLDTSLTAFPGIVWPVLLGGLNAIELSGRKARLYKIMALRLGERSPYSEEQDSMREQMRLTIWEHFTSQKDDLMELLEKGGDAFIKKLEQE